MQGKSKLLLIASMLIFGTIGIFRKYIPLSSSLLAIIRGLLGSLFLLLVLKLQKNSLSKESIKKNLKYLLISGALIGINWMLLFEAYNYTSVAVATLCYYMAPVFVILLSPFLLKEKLPISKIKYIALSVIGMVLVSGVLENGVENISEIKGIIFGLSAALCYGIVVILNKKIKNINAYDKTIVQLSTASVVLIPYTLLTEKIDFSLFTPSVTALVLIVGIIHTGIAYALYFGSMDKLKARTIAVFSYIDPVISVILSALLLKESIGFIQYIGAILVLGSALMGELKKD